VVLTPLSPHAGAAVLKRRERKSVLSRKDCKCGLFCTAARNLKFYIQGCNNVFKVFQKFLRPRMCAAFSGLGGLSSTQLCKLPRKKGTLFPGLLLKRGKVGGKQPDKAETFKLDSHLT
jgi:hypothetical protein